MLVQRQMSDLIERSTENVSLEQARHVAEKIIISKEHFWDIRFALLNGERAEKLCDKDLKTEQLKEWRAPRLEEAIWIAQKVGIINTMKDTENYRNKEIVVLVSVNEDATAYVVLERQPKPHGRNQFDLTVLEECRGYSPEIDPAEDLVQLEEDFLNNLND